MTETIPPSDLRPTQLYVNAAKLGTVLKRLDGPDHQFGPLPIYEFDGERYLTDGHTRAFAAYLTGTETVSVEYDENLAEEHDLALYRECIRWCEDAGVERVSDFTGRVLAPDEYERKWLDRCSRAAERLGDA
ncbi:histone acetyltransferase [Halosimplex sp. TS25]|uniref:histone acetyltransferase n=1 Tax=Halosimplex rarum TaxID=3396619 RepID=UPI0039E941CD